jgi:predicted RNA-binding protein with PIN domain
MYLIDGHNVVLRRGEGPEPRRREEFLRALDGWCARERKKAVVVFDSGREQRGGRRRHSARVEVVWAPEGKTADDVLIERIGKERDRTALVVVTSDSAVARAAEKRGMRVLGADQFLAQVHAEAPPDPPQSRQYRLPPAEVDEWIREFGLRDEEGTSR